VSKLSEAPLLAIFRQAQDACRQQNFADAVDRCREILSLSSNHAPATLMLAELLLRRDDAEQAVFLLEPLSKTHHSSPAVLFALGNAYRSQGRLDEAVAKLAAAVKLQPNFPAAYNNRGLVKWDLGDLDEATKDFERAIALDKNFLEARLNLSSLLLRRRRYETALEEAIVAVKIAPCSATAHHYCGIALQRSRRYAEAVTSQLTAISLAPSHAAPYVSASFSLCQMGKAESALALLDSAIAVPQDSAEIWHVRGMCLRALGRFAAAAEAYQKAIALNPDHGEPYRALVSIQVTLASEAEIAHLREMAADGQLSNENRSAIVFALAQMLEKNNCFDEAFEAAVAANSFARTNQELCNIKFDYPGFVAKNSEIVETFTPEFFASRAGWGVSSERPVFIVGFPRTGTTLVEQICSGHSMIFGAGELPDIGRRVRELKRSDGPASHWARDKMTAAATAHLAKLRGLAAGASRVVDKLPDNIFDLGFIALCFPKARVIFCHRDPRDAVLSVFFNRFPKTTSYATGLVEAGLYWRETERMAEHWRDALPLTALHVQYETLVQDFEREVRRIVHFLDLEWEPSCLDFHKVERTIMTPSNWQVRQPLYSTSVGRWRKYRTHIGDLCHAIGVAPDAPTAGEVRTDR